MLVRDLMIKDVVTAKKGISVKQCIDILFKMHIGSIVIIDVDRKIIGIFTERDIIRVIAQDIALNTQLEDVMTTNVVTVSIDSVFAEARELMRTYRIRRIPVVDSEGKLAGLISFRHIIDEFFEIIPRTR
jgi:CBS domain-containing protein